LVKNITYRKRFTYGIFSYSYRDGMIVTYIHWCRYGYEYIRHTLFFAWGLHCGCILKMTGSLLAELSCCDCLRVKVGRGIAPCPQWDV
jgi:hypothetical protein